MDYGLIGTVAAIVLIITVGAIITMIAIKFSFNFKIDWAERQKIKDEKMRLKLKNVCPHTLIESFDGDTGKGVIQSQFFQPSMSMTYTCRLCGYKTQDEEYVWNSIKIWEKDLWGLKEQIEEYQKLAKKYLG